MGQPRRIGNQKKIGQRQNLNSYVMCFSQSEASSTGRFSQLFRIGSMGQMQGSSRSRPASRTNNKQSFYLLVFDSFLISILQLKMFLIQMKGSQSQGANSPENNASFNSMNKKEIQPFRPHTISGLSVMP